jgi:hypothetical protein
MEIEIKVEPLDEIKIGVQSPAIGVPKGGTTGQVLSKKLMLITIQNGRTWKRLPFLIIAL